MDLLLAETGHYIILKKDNVTRKEYDSEKASRRYTNNDIIYNPEDGMLYFRKDMENPQNNFVPDNLFREQTYMVLVVTDEYVNDDNLGQALRQRLATTLGEERTHELIPSRETARSMLDQLDRVTQSLVLPQGVLLDVEERRQREKQISEQQDALWSSGSDLSKALVIRGLYDLATEQTKRTLGEDLDAWKKARLTVLENGQVDIQATPITTVE